MPATNSASRYGSVAKIFHWLTALGIIFMIPLGMFANDLAYDTAEQLATKAWLFSLHKTVGVALFFLALARIIWAMSQPKPAPLHPERRGETLLAGAVHWLLYGSLVVVPLSGWLHHAATEGFAPIWWPFGQDLPFVPKSLWLADATAGMHLVFERVLLVSLLLHVAGALKHALVDRDQTLVRMLPGGRVDAAPAPNPQRPRSDVTAPAVALSVWAMALGLGAALGVHETGTTVRTDTTTLAEVDSDWQVTEGTLGITIVQLGSEVTGQFATWSADIEFDETIVEGPAGRVDVEIAIPSLSLGSVSDQAMGTDYFAASEHPTARFSAEIEAQPDGYVAQGTLLLRGAEMPVALPFALTLDDDVARMEGQTRLDRRNFGIGDNMSDAGQLGFEVLVTVALTAQRSATNP